MRVFEQVDTSPQFLKSDDQDFWIALATLGGESLAESWSTPVVQLKGSPRADIPWLGNHGLVLNERAAHRLAAILTPCGELLPLQLDAEVDDRYYLFNPLLVIDALTDTSEIEYFQSTGNIKTILRPEFDPELIDGIDLFKVAGPHGSPLFLSEAFVAAVAAEGLIAPGFRLVWPLPPGQRLSRIPKPDYRPAS